LCWKRENPIEEELGIVSGECFQEIISVPVAAVFVNQCQYQPTNQPINQSINHNEAIKGANLMVFSSMGLASNAVKYPTSKWSGVCFSTEVVLNLWAADARVAVTSMASLC
jgi:hypothetical protein